MPNEARPSRPKLAAAALVFAALLGCPEQSTPQARGAGAAAASSQSESAVIPPQPLDTMPRDSVADLPRATVEIKYVTPTGQTIRVGERGSLQSALDRAKPGDVVALAPGAKYVGNFILPTKRCGAGWITLRTDVPDSLLPPAGTRITPSYAPRLAKILTRNDRAALATQNPTCGWWITGVEVGASPELQPTTVNYGLFLLGDGGWKEGGDTQTSLARMPTRIVVDRVYIHGEPHTNSTRCLTLNSGQTAVVNSWLSECHAKGFDSQAIEGWNGTGPFLIENNHLAGAGENVMFGGGDPGITNLVPTDITIRRNHVYKDPAWKGKWTIKNLFELKSARRVLVEGNVFENSWIDAQMGMAIVIKSALGTPNGGRWQGTTDVTFRDNIVRNTQRGFNVQAADGPTDNPVQRVRAENNLFENIGSVNGTGVDGWQLILLNEYRDVTIRHNTFVHNVTNYGISLVMEGGNGRVRNLRITDNVFTAPAGYAVFASGMKAGVESLRAMAGDSWTFERNVVAGVNPEYASWHPAKNWYPPKIASIGFVDPASGDYRLSAKSEFKRHGQGGTDPGVNMARLKQATEGVVVR
jgi:hypothetical protein